MAEFHETRMGSNFFESDVPRFVKAIEKLADAAAAAVPKPNPLETPASDLGLMISDCKGEGATDGLHRIQPKLIRCSKLDLGDQLVVGVLDGPCVHCGMMGSRQINLNSFNWD